MLLLYIYINKMVFLFKNKIPRADDLVMTKIENVDEYGITVSLPEYNNKLGYITFAEISRKKRLDKNIRKIISIGNENVMLVLTVDNQKGYIDLSKRDVKDTEVKDYLDKVKIHKNLYNLFKYILFKLLNIDSIESILEEELHPFLCETLFEIQEETKLDNQVILSILFDKEKNHEILSNIDYDNITWNLTQFKEIIDNYIDTKINVKKSTETINFRMLSYEINGNSDIKYALDFEKFDFFPQISQDFDIQINYASASNYSMVLNQKEFNMGEIKSSIELLVKEINKRALEKKIMLC